MGQAIALRGLSCAAFTAAQHPIVLPKHASFAREVLHGRKKLQFERGPTLETTVALCVPVTSPLKLPLKFTAELTVPLKLLAVFAKTAYEMPK